MRKTVWDSMLDADMNERYWSKLSRRYYNRDKRHKIFLAVMSSGTVATWGIWIDVEILWKVLSGISALTAIALPILNWEKDIEKMSVLKTQWAEIKNDYESLWSNISKKEEDVIEQEYKKIKSKELESDKLETNLPDNKKLLKICHSEVIKSRGLN